MKESVSWVPNISENKYDDSPWPPYRKYTCKDLWNSLEAIHGPLDDKQVRAIYASYDPLFIARPITAGQFIHTMEFVLSRLRNSGEH